MKTLYNITMFFIAPFIGLFYILAFPTILLPLLVWYTIIYFLSASIKEGIKSIFGPKAISYELLLNDLVDE